MVEELICAGLQCFGEHITKGIEALLQLATAVNPSLPDRQNKPEVEHE